MFAQNPKKIVKLIKTHYERKIPLFIYGSYGIGKSELVKTTAKEIAKKKNKELVFWDELNEKEKQMVEKNPKSFFVLIDQRLSNADPTDVKGIPNFNDETKREHLNWVIDRYLKFMTNPDADGIMFFDEMNQAPPSVLNGFFKIFHDRKVNDEKLNDNVSMIACGNLLEDKAHIHDLPNPLRDRMSEVELVFNSDDWYEWAMKNNIDTRLIVFLKFKPSYLNQKVKDRNMKDSTPRGIAQTSILIKDVKDEETTPLVSARLGEAFGREMSSFLKLNKKLNISDLMRNPKKVQEINETDLKFSVVSGVVEHYKKDKKKTIEACSQIAEYMQVEFAVLLLKLMKATNESFFKQNIIKTKNWNKLATEFGKYLLD